MPLRFFPFLNRCAPAIQTLQLSLRAVEEAQTELGTLLTKLDTHKYGLTAAQSRQRLRQFGRNEIIHDLPLSWYGQLLHAFNNPFVYLLLGLAIASWLTGDTQGMGGLLAIVLLSGLFRFGREYYSTQVAAKLRALVDVTASISRYNDVLPRERRQEIPIHKLVPGDIVHLSAGKMVPADVRLLEAKDLFVSQAILTGESTLVQKHDTLGNPVEKIAIRYARPNPPDPLDTPTICFMGTTVMGGTARAVVGQRGIRLTWDPAQRSQQTPP
jgi:Cation transport ATPase